MRAATVCLLACGLAVVSCADDVSTKVKEALKEAMENIGLMNDVSTILGEDETAQLQKAGEGSILAQRTGDILQEATRLLIEKNGAAFLSKLSGLDVVALLNEVAGVSRAKRQYDGPMQSDPSSCINRNSCDKSFPFRSISGFCNHDNNANVGSTFHPFRRFMGEAKYDDGFNSVRTKSAAGGSLPSARVVSNKIFKEANVAAYDPKYSHMLQQFGQFIAHDTVFTPSSVGANNAALNCKPCNSGQLNSNCAPIEVPSGDEYFPSTVNGTRNCIRLTRAINGQTGIGPRAQINQDTHFLDLSDVYGSDDCVANDLRDVNGLMRMYTSNGYTLPPQALNDTHCPSQPKNLCFFAGDLRNSLHPGLIPLHTIYLLHHNKLAKEIKQLRPTWSSNSIYHEARRLTIALWQFHSYVEYLPKIIGNNLVGSLGLKPSGLKKMFDPRVNPSISAEFGAAAFRFGHSQVRKDIPRATISTQAVTGAAIDLGKNIFYSDTLYDKAADVFTMAMGMVANPAMAVDRQFSFPIRNQLFEIRNQPASGVDLSAVNIQRGREMGLHPYNEVRPRVGLAKVTSFDALTNDMGAENVALLKATYAHVDDIDLYVGLLLEKPRDGTALLGPTGAYLIADQFDSWKRGDRFFYESLDNNGALTPAEYSAVTNYKLAQLLCDTIPGLTSIQEDIFIVSAKKVSCSSFPKFPLSSILYA